MSAMHWHEDYFEIAAAGTSQLSKLKQCMCVCVAWPQDMGLAGWTLESSESDFPIPYGQKCSSANKTH